ncbi:hypothetical protein EBU71_19680, partial [bacterium]|nr:hypothetical protein [Candidatus Elulimicrobium humile]
PNSGNPINVQLYDQNMKLISTIYKFTPPVNSWTLYSTSFTVSKSQTYKLYFSGTTTNADRSSAVQGISLDANFTGSGNYTYDDCRLSAINEGYQFFALQNVNTNTSKGFCAVSNSSPSLTQYGESMIPSVQITLWSSNTGGQSGNTSSLDGNGSLQVLNSGGTSVFSTPIPDSSKPSGGNYIGCYKMSSKWSDTYRISGTKDHSTSFDDCQDLATNNGFSYFAYQGYLKKNNSRRCLGFNDLKTPTSQGGSKNCKSETSAGDSAGVLYSLSEDLYSYLILQDDGNMCIYKGSGPNDNQGLIWQSETNGKQQSANSSMQATNNKYGQNWMPSGSTLAAGDYLSSNSGDMVLMMQDDGNLVLYTFQMVTNCQTMNDGNMGGGVQANAAYDIGNAAITKNMGLLGFVDENSILYSYPNSNTAYTNTYNVINGIDATGNDIKNASFSGATLDSCEDACNSNSS